LALLSSAVMALRSSETSELQLVATVCAEPDWVKVEPSVE